MEEEKQMRKSEHDQHVINAVETDYLYTARNITDLRQEIETTEKLLASKRADLDLLIDKRNALADFLGYDE
jgi:hypothetical protein